MRAPQERTMRDLYDRTRHKDLAAPEVRRAASTAAPTACALAVVGFSPIGRDGTRWGDCFRLGWGRSGFRDSRFCTLHARACSWDSGFVQVTRLYKEGESNLIEYVYIPPV